MASISWRTAIGVRACPSWTTTRLCPTGQRALSAVQFMSKDHATGVPIAFRTHLPRCTDAPPLRLQSLDPWARYEIEGSGVRSGAAWMWAGIAIGLRDDDSTVRRIVRLEEAG
jgi:hypothetical protein